MHTSNRLLGGITVVSGAAVWLAAGSIQMPADSHTLSPQFFPKLMAVAMIVLGGLLFAMGKGRPLADVFRHVRAPRNFLLVACTLAFTTAFGHVDYRLLCPVYIAAVLWILGRRKPGGIIVISVTATAVLYLLFRYGFMVLLPEMG